MERMELTKNPEGFLELLSRILRRTVLRWVSPFSESPQLHE